MTKQEQQLEQLRQRLQARMFLEGRLRDIAKVDRTTRGLRKRVALQSAGVKHG